MINEKKDSLMPPIFLIMPSREVLHRMIVKACEFNTLKDMNAQI